MIKSIPMKTRSVLMVFSYTIFVILLASCRTSRTVYVPVVYNPAPAKTIVIREQPKVIVVRQQPDIVVVKQPTKVTVVKQQPDVRIAKTNQKSDPVPVKYTDANNDAVKEKEKQPLHNQDAKRCEHE